MTASVDPKRLIELLRIADHGSFTRAAATLGVSQPALSNSMGVLERMLGVRVFERTRNGASLTEFGQLLAGHAAAIDSVLSRAAGELEAKKRGLEGSLVVGASPVACIDIVPKAVALLLRETPNIVVSIEERADDELIAGLRSGEIDLVVNSAGLLAEGRDIVSETLARDIFVVAMRKGHQLASKKSLLIADLRDAQWVMPSPHTTMSRQIELLFSAENQPWPSQAIITNSITALKSIVMQSECVTISSKKLVELEVRAGCLACVPMRKRHFTREICLRRRRAPRSPLVERLIAAVRAATAGTDDE
ncbi:MAG TPA: LysR family transcriptional regulator [Xanthobacteraceae bacterium]|nr:LysR family transcriptional regulator [Xanthobacteraceae bacterium]